MKIPANLKGKELFNWLVQNKNYLITEKKSTVKYCDCITTPAGLFVNDKGEITKAEGTESPIPTDATKLDASLVINTTNWFDSHRDVHIPGLWKKSLQETKDFYLLKEHVMSFENVISDEIKAFTKKLGWKDLGLDMTGTTEALIFQAKLDKDRHPFMFDQYRKGYVKNHSVGMRYISIKMAINDEDYKEEFSNWNQYIDDIANRDEAEAVGYFWAVLEAKVIEGSAVLKGSNRITPVQSIQQSKQDSTDEQPPVSTESSQPQQSSKESEDKAINWDRIAEAILN